MDPIIAHRLSTEEEFGQEVSKIAREYLQLGREELNHWSGDFDVAYDMMMCYAPLGQQDYEKLERGHPKRFILPTSSTQITTMATFISQVLFGQATPHKVEPRGPEDDVPAEFINQLLRWNAEQNESYLKGYLWVEAALLTNRAVFYNYWSPLYAFEVVNEEAVNPYTGSNYFRPVRKKKLIGGFNKFDIISPYDFFSDPAMPLWRFQDGRFAGHSTIISMVELQQRSELPPDHPQYVLPSAVAKLLDKKQKPSATSTIPSTSTPPSGTGNRLSRAAYERGRRIAPVGSSQKANDKDGGSIEIQELWVKLVPRDYDLGESNDVTTYRFLLANHDTVLSLEESTYAHGTFPYSVGEARPSSLIHYGPSWMIMLKGIQDYVDWLKNRHQEALSRTIGNVFIFDPEKVDVEDFLNPEKEGLLIPLKPAAGGAKISDCIQQVPLKDMTENFQEEMVQFARMSENITGANTYMQGQTDGEASATEFASTQQMAAGRLSSIARMLSVQGLVPQTRQFVSNFQQFLELPQAIRFSPTENSPEQLLGVVSLVLKKDLIQGSFDFIPHDGTLPGTDGKKVAAIKALLEAAAAFPQVFTPEPGNLDPRKLIYAGAKASGMNVENFKWRPQDIPTPPPQGGPPGIPPGPGGPEMTPMGATNKPPGPAPANISAPSLPQISLPSAEPPQIRPSQM